MLNTNNNNQNKHKLITIFKINTFMKKRSAFEPYSHLIRKYNLARLFILNVVFLMCINFSAFGAAISFSGVSGANWKDASNWSSGALPTADDDVSITGKTVNVLSGDNVVAGSITLSNSGESSVGTLTIQKGGKLTVSSTTISLSIQGGIINNAGTISVIAKSGQNTALLWMRNTSGSSTKTPSTFNNTGTLILDASAGGVNAICIALTQGDAGVQATFSTGGTINLIPNNISSAFVIDVTSRDALITGTGTISAGTANTPLIATFIRILSASKSPNTATRSLTIDKNVILNYIGSGYAFMNYTANDGVNTSTVINKGTINLSGTSNYPIFMTAQGTDASSSVTFDNRGTINANGAPASSNSGAITFNSSGNSIFLNSGGINFNPTSNGAFINTTSNGANVSITNTGIISVGSAIALTNAIILGDSKTSLTNTGTISINSGNIKGISGTGKAIFNNNTKGVLNLSNSTAVTKLTSNASLVFNNNGGTINPGMK